MANLICRVHFFYILPFKIPHCTANPAQTDIAETGAEQRIRWARFKI